MSVISARDIVFPLKKHYQEGELIKAKFQKKTFQAAICEIHREYKALEVNMAKTFFYTVVFQSKIRDKFQFPISVCIL